MADFFQTEITNLKRYRQQIRKLFTKLKERKALFTTQQAGVSYFNFGMHEQKLAKLLRDAVIKETYQFQPAKQQLIVVNNKRRTIYTFALLDKIVMSVLITILAELAETYLADQLFSYRKRRRPLTAAKQFSKYVRAHTQKFSKSQRGCYLLKTDIADYTDNIRLDAHSKLWQLLDEMLLKNNCHLTTYQQQLIRASFRPIYEDESELLQCNIKGVPTGSIASTLAYNLYCAEIDRQISQIPELYYSRYCDDILIAHANPNILQQAIQKLQQMLQTLGLTRRQAKDQLLYLTMAAKKPPYAEWDAGQKLTYLGYEIYADGSLMLSSKRLSKLLKALRQRIANVVRLCRDSLKLAELGKTVCQAINAALIDEIFGEQAVPALLECNHLGMLKHLDYLIALAIAEAISCQKGVKAFRKIPYYRIRTEWGLISLVQRAVHLSYRKQVK